MNFKVTEVHELWSSNQYSVFAPCLTCIVIVFIIQYFPDNNNNTLVSKLNHAFLLSRTLVYTINHVLLPSGTLWFFQAGSQHFQEPLDRSCQMQICTLPRLTAWHPARVFCIGRQTLQMCDVLGNRRGGSGSFPSFRNSGADVRRVSDQTTATTKLTSHKSLYKTAAAADAAYGPVSRS